MLPDVGPDIMPENDPLLGYQYRIEVSSSAVETDNIYFMEVSGLGSENEVSVQPRTKDGIGTERKVPGRLKFQDVVLKRGVTSNMALWDWRDMVAAGKMTEARSNASIVLLNLEGEDVARWDLVNAWPSKITTPAFKSDSNEFSVEELTIVHEGMERTE